jgi:hypothetical protein
MILLRPVKRSQYRMADLTDLFAGQAALLMGGAPSLKQQPLGLLQQRGVLTVAMNNAAVHFQPDLWISSDRPECYEPQILLDPKIMKMAPVGHADIQLDARYGSYRYANMPNMFFYTQEDKVPWDEFLEPRRGVPWYQNTLMSAIHILYQLGIRTIILGGSDFGYSPLGDMYAHTTKLGALERKWNLDLYNSLVEELRTLQRYFATKKLQFMDCSKYSRLKQTYPHISMEEAVALCRRTFPEQPMDTAELPHCSKFASMDIKKAIAGWPGHGTPGPAITDKLPEANEKPDALQLVI